MMALRQALVRTQLSVLGIFVAVFVAASVKTVLAQDCGCSGSACGGCSISYQNCTFCGKNCSQCEVWGSEDCEIGWECEG
jgi:hypothetical protein